MVLNNQEKEIRIIYLKKTEFNQLTGESDAELNKLNEDVRYFLSYIVSYTHLFNRICLINL